MILGLSVNFNFFDNFFGFRHVRRAIARTRLRTRLKTLDVISLTRLVCVFFGEMPWRIKDNSTSSLKNSLLRRAMFRTCQISYDTDRFILFQDNPDDLANIDSCAYIW